MIQDHNGKLTHAADQLRALRLKLHRKVDRLLARACEPTFTGEVWIKVTYRAGHPGKPRAGIEEYDWPDE